MKKETKMAKIKVARPFIYDGKPVPKDTVLTVPETEAKLYMRSGKAVVAGPQKKEAK